MEIRELARYQLQFASLGSVSLREAKLNQVDYFQIFETNSFKWNCNIDKDIRTDGFDNILIKSLH